jgi:hypothetical protein
VAIATAIVSVLTGVPVRVHGCEPAVA